MIHRSLFLTYFKSKHRDRCTDLTHRITIVLQKHATNLSGELIFVAHFETHIRTDIHTRAITLLRSSLASAVKSKQKKIEKLTFRVCAKQPLEDGFQLYLVVFETLPTKPFLQTFIAVGGGFRFYRG
jgi:hypothetical protein